MFRPSPRPCASAVLPSLLLLVAGALTAPAAEPVAPPAPQQPPRKVITLCGNKMELMTADEVKAMGFPWVDVPDDQNAATYYIQGANALHELVMDQETRRQRDRALKHGWDDRMKELAATETEPKT